VNFVAELKDPRIGICVDTCHVFACGHDPLQYIEYIYKTHPSLLKLVHYNDSAAPCGSCKDRHALFGTGHIGLEKMTRIAQFCREHTYPMVIE
jgi:endonuclease IV